VYYDDNLWIALALVEASRVERSSGPAQTAKEIFTLVGDGWDRNGADPCPGGVFWTRPGANHDRNTVTTANAALLALHLYATSRSLAYLDWARKAYLWVERCLGTPSGLVADHIDLAGNVDPHTWSYNQGAMIAAGVQLYESTGDRSYLEDAERTADASLEEIGDPLASGEPPVFLAIFYRDLLELTRAVSGRNDRAALERFADEAWERARSPKTGLFHFDGRGPTLLDQAAMVQVYAELAEST
jgi:predicted alpha-1,6-mannanase (GH76 family)